MITRKWSEISLILFDVNVLLTWILLSYLSNTQWLYFVPLATYHMLQWTEFISKYNSLKNEKNVKVHKKTTVNKH